MLFDNINSWVIIIAFPIITLVLWQLLFNSKNSYFTKAVVEGGYMLLGIPLIILTFLSIPLMALLLWAQSQNIGSEITTALLVVLGLSTLIVEYYWIRRQIRMIEEREQMSIWAYLKRSTSKEYRENVAQEKKENKKQAESFFDEITDMNRKRRELDREEKEKLRRALLGELDSE